MPLRNKAAKSGSSPASCSPSWERGYFCAVAAFLKENYSEGVAGSDAQSLFGQGGDWKKADPEDIETFRLHGLIPPESAPVLATADNKTPTP